MEAVGTPADLRAVRHAGACRWTRCQHRRPRQPATLHLEDLWIKNITITTGLVDTYSTPTLMGLVAATTSTLAT